MGFIVKSKVTCNLISSRRSFEILCLPERPLFLLFMPLILTFQFTEMKVRQK